MRMLLSAMLVLCTCICLHVSKCCQVASCVAKCILQVSFSEALAVQSSGSIAAVGCSAEVLLLQQPATQVTNLQGAFVMPVSPLHTATLQVNAVGLSAEILMSLCAQALYAVHDFVHLAMVCLDAPIWPAHPAAHRLRGGPFIP